MGIQQMAYNNVILLVDPFLCCMAFVSKDHSLYGFNSSHSTFQLFRDKFQFSKLSFIVIAIKPYTILQNQHEFESLKPCDH